MSIKIDQALDNTALSGSLKIDLIFENGVYSKWGTAYTNKRGVYEPNAKREHIELRNFPASTAAFTINDTDEYVGLYQAIIKYPADIGAITIKQKAEEFLNLFEIGAALTYDSQKVYPTSKNRDGGRIEGGFYQIVCSVNYRAFITRG